MDGQIRQKEFLAWPDLIRVVAAILVIVVHVSGQLTNVWGQIPVSHWIIADIYGGIARICVPLFFMISGYLLLPRQESLGTFYRKRMPKVIFPFVVWSLIYLGWFCGNHPGTCNPRVVQDMLFVQGAYYHLWYLYALIGIYLILPLLRLTIGPHTDLKILWYFIILWLIFQSSLDIAGKFWGFTTRLHPPLTASYVGFFFLGYLLGPWKLYRSTVILAAGTWILATLVTIAGTYFLTKASGKFDGFFYVFTTPNVILASAAAFLLLKWISDTRAFAAKRTQEFIRGLATASFGVYLIHVLIIEILQGWIPGFHLDSFMGNPMWSIPLVVLIVFCISLLIVRILQMVPVLKRIVPG